MRTKYILFAFLLFLAAGLLYLRYFVSFPEPEPFPTPSPTPISKTESPIPKNTMVLEEADNLEASFIKVSTTSAITLLPNFEEKLTSRDAKEKHQCNNLVSAGFYTKEGDPVGMFVFEGKTIRPWSQNSLFNGILTVKENGEVKITQKQETEEIRFALQSGPILMLNGKVQTLNIANDTKERRILVAKTKEDEVVFIALYNAKSVYLGPSLAEVPSLLTSFQEKTGMNLFDALNLDGGTASAFHSESLTFSELTHAGSFFCLK